MEEPTSVPESQPPKRPLSNTPETQRPTKKTKKEARKITEETRNRFQQRLDEFQKSNDEVYTFEASLSNYERAEVHKLWRQMGMQSKSSGKPGAGRCISLYKIKAKISKKKKKKKNPNPNPNQNENPNPNPNLNPNQNQNQNQNQTPKQNQNQNQYMTRARTRLTARRAAKVKTPISFMPRRTKEVKTPISSFTFSEEGKTVLRDFFSYYPPGDDKETEKIAVTSGKNTGDKPMRTDDIFSRPAIKKDQIAKDLASVVARRQSDNKLKQVTLGRSKLPIASFKDGITSTIESNQVVLISGETGCGKTTQVPQYLLDHMWSKGEACKIVCTQPRRISAMSVAERIASERGEPIGQSVGYKIRLGTKGGKHSSIVFCTNGVLLRILIRAGARSAGKEKSAKRTKDAFPDITHIIVDEIHERDRFSDFMLTIIREILPLYPRLRVVLMSATLDAKRFSEYFGGCPVIRVPGFTYDVKKFYLEDVLMLVKSESTNARSLNCTSKTNISEKSKLTKAYKRALDEAINIAWSTDELDTLLDIVSMGDGLDTSNYQHSVTGVTPLMVFARKGRVGDICMLLSLGANCHLQDNEGKTALSWAEHANEKEASEILRKHLNATVLDPQEEKLLLDKYLKDVNPELVDVILIEKLLRKICTDSKEGAILVFLPGWDEIKRLQEKLLSNILFNDSSKFSILVLHSMVPSTEQKKVFIRPPNGCRKIVLSTNVAETSVTIDDVVFVIDSGRVKEKSYDVINKVSTLQSCWISKANAKQREGRAGRCQPGVCYHLYSKLRAASLMEFQVPEIKRTPIDELCLQVKLLDPSSKIKDFLKKTLDPPVPLAIQNAITVLQDVGALTPDEELTELGEKFGSIAVHPLTCKMLLFAISMNCLDPALTLACATGFKDPFTLPMVQDGKTNANAAKSELASSYGSHGDQLAIIAAYERWNDAKRNGKQAEFCSQYFVSAGVMRMLSSMRKQLQRDLFLNGFIPEDSSNFSQNSQDSGVINALLVAGLYPKVGRLHRMGKKYVIEDVDKHKVRLGRQSVISRLSLKRKDVDPFVIYDEVTRGDAGLNIKNCSIVGSLPLLLLAAEIAVAPVSDGEVDFMSSPDNVVKVIADGWLLFKSTALEAAQICCLRERLSDAILFKITHPRKDLPQVLAASVDAIAKLLSCDGVSGIKDYFFPKVTETVVGQQGENGPITGSVDSSGLILPTVEDTVGQFKPGHMLQGEVLENGVMMI